MYIYKLKVDAKAMGVKDETYGFTYEVYSHDTDLPIRFSSHKTDFLEGRSIVAEKRVVKPFKSGKREGQDYIWLSGVKLADSDDSGSQGGGTVPTSSPEATQAPQNPETAAGYEGSITKAQGDEIIRLLKIVAMENEETEEETSMPKNFLGGEDDEE